MCLSVLQHHAIKVLFGCGQVLITARTNISPINKSASSVIFLQLHAPTLSVCLSHKINNIFTALKRHSVASSHFFTVKVILT